MLWLMPADLLRQRIGMIFISIDAIRAACCRLGHGCQMSGGKGAKGGNPFLGPHSGAQVFLEGLRGSAYPVAEIAENAEIAGTHRGMSGGKGAKGGNLESAGKTGPPDDAAKRRKPAETGGNPFWGLYGGGEGLPGARVNPPPPTVAAW